MLDRAIEKMVPVGWTWSLYGPSGELPARAVLVSPDFRTHIGRNGRTAEDAIRIAARDARGGMRE